MKKFFLFLCFLSFGFMQKSFAGERFYKVDNVLKKFPEIINFIKDFKKTKMFIDIDFETKDLEKELINIVCKKKYEGVNYSKLTKKQKNQLWTIFKNSLTLDAKYWGRSYGILDFRNKFMECYNIIIGANMLS